MNFDFRSMDSLASDDKQEVEDLSDTATTQLHLNKAPRSIVDTSKIFTQDFKSKIKKAFETHSRVVDRMPMQVLDDEHVLKRYQNFKKFDTVVDHSDHLFAARTSPMNQPPKDWSEKIQQEWRILEEHLPETIFVRVYKSRMDLLRVVIVGPQGTPYHDGLFFFDVYFPTNYPNTPPVVRYHSYGLSISPNIYKCGEVDLRPIETRDAKKVDIWVPATWNMLQLLVSIQSRILSSNPFLVRCRSGRLSNEMGSLLYNENTFIKTLKTMEYIMNKPPKNFKDLVVGHFRNRVRDILMACKAYTEGAIVGGYPVRGVQKESCSIEFKNDVASCIKSLVSAFYKVGANEAQEFLPLSEMRTPYPVSALIPLDCTKARRMVQLDERMVDSRKKAKIDDLVPQLTEMKLKLSSGED